MKWFYLIEAFYKNKLNKISSTDYDNKIYNVIINKLDVERKFCLLRKHIRYTKQAKIINKGKAVWSFDPNGNSYSNIIIIYNVYYVNGMYRNISKNTKERIEEFEHFSKNQKQAYKEKIAFLMQEYGKPITDDDDFVSFIIQKMPSSVFNKEDTLLWRKIYDFTTIKKLNFRIVDKAKKKEKEIRKQTYIDFANSIDTNCESCNGRFFVKLFCHHTGEKYARVDDMLRYKAEAEFFSKQDFLNIGICKEDFFDVIETIKRISKKEAD